MANKVFVDAGAWIALANRRDKYHTNAKEQYQTLLSEKRQLVTTNLVVAEAYALIRRSGGHAPAMRFLRALRQSTRLRKIYSDAALEDVAENLLDRFSDQSFSFVDAASFALMEKEEIKQAFAFDQHFITAGFVLLP